MAQRGVMASQGNLTTPGVMVTVGSTKTQCLNCHRMVACPGDPGIGAGSLHFSEPLYPVPKSQTSSSRFAMAFR